MPYDQPFAVDDGLPDFDPREAAKDLQLQRMKQQVQDNPWALGVAAAPPGKSPRAFLDNPAPRPQDPLTPVYEVLSPAQTGYSVGQAIGETVKAPTLWEKAEAAFPLIAGMVMPVAPKGAGGRGVKVRPEILRELDSLGFYSQALEAAKAWPQPRGTPEQVMAALKQAGVKDAEIAATNLQGLLAGKPSVTRDELVQHLRDNRVALNENRYGNAQHEVIRSEDGAVMDGPYGTEREAESRRRAYRDPSDLFVESAYPPDVTKGEPKWADYSLDPSNPSYRESVLHLPGNEAGIEARLAKVDAEAQAIKRSGPRWQEDPEAWARYQELESEAIKLHSQASLAYKGNFRSGHWDEPNVMAHMRTSVQKDAQGKPVFLVDELQSDWGQKLRDGGARDEAKIMAAKKAVDDAYQTRLALAQRAYNLAKHVGLDEKMGATFEKTMRRNSGELDIPSVHTAMDWIKDPAKHGAENVAMAKQLSDEMYAAVQHEKLREAEHKTLLAATPGHPLVNTTDQWVTTAQRRLLQQAMEAKAEGIAITPGQLQNERFGLEKVINHATLIPYGEGDPYFGYLMAGPHGRRDVDVSVRDRAHLDELLGSETAGKLLSQPLAEVKNASGSGVQGHRLEGVDLRSGGQGMRYAYDQMYPKALEKQLRKLDPEYPGRGTTEIGYSYPSSATRSAGDDSAAFHYFPITERVREAVAKGLPLFSSAALMALIPQVQQKRPELDERAPFGYDQ